MDMVFLGGLCFFVCTPTGVIDDYSIYYADVKRKIYLLFNFCILR